MLRRTTLYYALAPIASSSVVNSAPPNYIPVFSDPVPRQWMPRPRYLAVMRVLVPAHLLLRWFFGTQHFGNRHRLLRPHAGASVNRGLSGEAGHRASDIGHAEGRACFQRPAARRSPGRLCTAPASKQSRHARSCCLVQGRIGCRRGGSSFAAWAKLAQRHSWCSGRPSSGETGSITDFCVVSAR